MPSRSPTTRRAVVDVGTNSVKLLVADVGIDSITPVFEVGEQTRLGRGFYETQVLQQEAIDRTASVVADFVQRARELGATEIRPFATSAARDARNADALIDAVRDAGGFDLTVISGETEAEWAFQGAASNPTLDGHRFLLIDVGGGSTEFILGQGGHRHFSQSFPMGTVRMIEELPHNDPPTFAELGTYRKRAMGFLHSEVQPQLAPSLKLNGAQSVLLAATGGTASILAMMEAKLTEFDRDRVESVKLTDAVVSRWVETLWGMPLAQRRQLPGLPPPRADVMLAGVVIFEAIMRAFDFRELKVSTRGLRFAALMELWKGA
jgi:exopolyphosphatase/guanosine-5'-triphosphate,3'-diphosphate pyrophosphatase